MLIQPIYLPPFLYYPLKKLSNWKMLVSCIQFILKTITTPSIMSGPYICKENLTTHSKIKICFISRSPDQIILKNPRYIYYQNFGMICLPILNAMKTPLHSKLLLKIIYSAKLRRSVCCPPNCRHRSWNIKQLKPLVYLSNYPLV